MVMQTGAAGRRPFLELRLRRFGVALGFLILLVSTRWPARPGCLLSFDAANFAFAIEEFNPALHQPQPPGYPLCVLLLKILHLALPNAPDAFFWSAVVASLAALVFLWLLGDLMLNAGLAAALLLGLHPLLWYSSLAGPVRPFLAAQSTGLALLLWKAWREPRAGLWLSVSAFALGASAGFRPEVSVTLGPLLLVAAVRARAVTPRVWLRLVLLSLAGALPWFAYTSFKAGGVGAYLQLLTGYLHAQASGSSILLGAARENWLSMTRDAAVWNLIGVPVFAWVLPWTMRRLKGAIDSEIALFLALWFLPGFLFQCLVHAASPDHVLATVPVACLAGGAALRTLRGWRFHAALGAALALSAALFFLPLPGPAAEANYREIRRLRSLIKPVAGQLAANRSANRTLVTSADSPWSYRLLGYYAGPSPVLTISAAQETGDQRPRVGLVRRNRIWALQPDGGEVRLPCNHELLWLLPADSPYLGQLRSAAATRPSGPFLATLGAGSGGRIALGPYLFTSAPCGERTILEPRREEIVWQMSR